MSMSIVHPSQSPSPRRKLHTLKSSEYEHEFDNKALASINKIPILPSVFRKLNQLGIEKLLKIQLTGSYLKITDRNFPHVYQIFEEACQILEIEKPPLFYIEPGFAQINAFTAGVEQPILVVNRYAVDMLTEEELLFVLGHELGHVKSNHLLHTQVASVLPSIGEAIGNATFGLGSIATSGLQLGLDHWRRMAEFTADRAGLLTCQDLRVATKTLMKMAGLHEKYFNETVVEDFILQAQEFHEYSYDNLDKIVKFFSNLQNTHPWTVVRASEMLKWVESPEYNFIINRSQNSTSAIVVR